MEAALPGASLSEQVVAGEQVQELLDHPGFGVLAHIVHIHREGLRDRVVYRKPDWNSANYADAIGHLRGLGEFVPLAKGIVENGKAAAQAVRENEERGT